MEAVNNHKSVPRAVAPPPANANGRAHATPGAELTPRETDVLDMVRQALTNREIADRLGLSEKTVKGHMTAVMKKLGVHNRVEVALISERRHNVVSHGR